MGRYDTIANFRNLIHDAMKISTADLTDQYPGVSIAAPVFRAYGAKPAFSGRITTVKCFEDNSLVREILGTPGGGGVLVIDGGGSLNCALLGDVLAQKAFENNWSGVIVNGCVRDSAVIAGIEIGVRALAAHPLKSVKRGLGDKNVPVRFAGVEFTPGHYVYTDTDGIIVSPRELNARDQKKAG